MSATSEALSYQLSLNTILAYSGLSVPTFQRPYSWGAPGKDFAARSYFQEFLANRAQNHFFGFVTLYSATRHDFEKGTHVDAYIADGQHRLVTVVLGALAVQRALSYVAQHSHRDASNRAAALLSQHHKLITVLTGSNIEVKLAPGAVPVRLTNFIWGQATKLAELKLERGQIESDYRDSLWEIRRTVEISERREAKQWQTRDKNRKLERVTQKEKELGAVHAWRSYRLLEEALLTQDDPDYSECLSYCEAFLDRIEGYCIWTVCLVPRWNGRESLDMLESEAFKCFVQANGGMWLSSR